MVDFENVINVNAVFVKNVDCNFKISKQKILKKHKYHRHLQMHKSKIVYRRILS